MTEEWAEAFHGRQGDKKMSVPKARGNKDEGRVNMRVSSMEYRVSGVAPRATLSAKVGDKFRVAGGSPRWQVAGRVGLR